MRYGFCAVILVSISLFLTTLQSYARPTHARCAITFPEWEIMYSIEIVPASQGLVDVWIKTSDYQGLLKEFKVAEGLKCIKNPTSGTEPLVLCSDRKPNGSQTSELEISKRTNKYVSWYSGNAYNHETFVLTLNSPTLRSMIEKGDYRLYEDGVLTLPDLEEKNYSEFKQSPQILIFKGMLTSYEWESFQQNKKLYSVKYSFYRGGTGYCTTWKDSP